MLFSNDWKSIVIAKTKMWATISIESWIVKTPEHGTCDVCCLSKRHFALWCVTCRYWGVTRVEVTLEGAYIIGKELLFLPVVYFLRWTKGSPQLIAHTGNSERVLFRQRPQQHLILLLAHKVYSLFSLEADILPWAIMGNAIQQPLQWPVQAFWPTKCCCVCAIKHIVC